MRWATALSSAFSAQSFNHCSIRCSSTWQTKQKSRAETRVVCETRRAHTLVLQRPKKTHTPHAADGSVTCMRGNGSTTVALPLLLGVFVYWVRCSSSWRTQNIAGRTARVMKVEEHRRDGLNFRTKDDQDSRIHTRHAGDRSGTTARKQFDLPFALHQILVSRFLLCSRTPTYH